MFLVGYSKYQNSFQLNLKIFQRVLFVGQLRSNLGISESNPWYLLAIRINLFCFDGRIAKIFFILWPFAIYMASVNFTE